MTDIGKTTQLLFNFSNGRLKDVHLKDIGQLDIFAR